MEPNNIYPPISVAVVTYNSSATIIDTLESIKNQTYNNIELVVSDDCSSDDTISICKKWIDENKGRFLKTKLLEIERNTGVAANNNRAIQATASRWIKPIAGDDKLVPSALEEFYFFVKENPDVRICVSDLEVFSDEVDVPSSTISTYKSHFECVKESYERQLYRIKYEMRIAGPGLFIQRALFNEVGGYEEKYPLGEEWPFFYKILMKGVRIYPVDKKLVLYRYSHNSLLRKKQNNGLGNSRHFFSNYHFFFDYPFHDLIHDRRYLLAWHKYLSYNALRFRYETKNSVVSRFWGRIHSIISPWAYLRFLHIVRE